jgi:RNA polymerase sigma factor (sigma-70 family)
MNSVPLEDPHVHILCTDVSHDFVLAERAVKAEVEKLPDKYRTIIECCYFNDLSYKSIAKNEKINVSTVRSRLSRAKAKLKHKKILRNCLEEYL